MGSGERGVVSCRCRYLEVERRKGAGRYIEGGGNQAKRCFFLFSKGGDGLRKFETRDNGEELRLFESQM